MKVILNLEKKFLGKKYWRLKFLLQDLVPGGPEIVASIENFNMGFHPGEEANKIFKHQDYDVISLLTLNSPVIGSVENPGKTYPQPGDAYRSIVTHDSNLTGYEYLMSRYDEVVDAFHTHLQSRRKIYQDKFEKEKNTFLRKDSFYMKAEKSSIFYKKNRNISISKILN